MSLERLSADLGLPALVLSVLLSSVAPACGQSPSFWPQFHGPNRDNKSTETDLVERWPENGPALLWTAQGIGHGYASVSIAEGLIYTAGNIDDDTVISALDLDGRIRWQAANGKAWTHPKPGARGTPTLDGRRLYHESPYGDVVCLDARSGRKIWGLNILEKFRSQNIQWALAESLLIDGDRVICCPGGPETAVVALDKFNGMTRWKSPSAGDLAGYGSPALAEYRGLRMILTMTSRAVIAVNADNGDLLWRYEYITPFDETIFTPIYHDGHVFVTTRTVGATMLKLRVDGDTARVDKVWRTKDLDNQHSGVVLVDGYLYGACHTSNHAGWVCLDWKTGRKMYADRGVGRGSLTYADGMFYTMSERGTVALVPADPAGHRIVSQFRIPAGGEGPTWAHPVVCGGRLYIRHSDVLYAYDVREP